MGVHRWCVFFITGRVLKNLRFVVLPFFFFSSSSSVNAPPEEGGLLAKEDMGRYAGELLMPLMKSIYSNADKCVDP